MPSLPHAILFSGPTGLGKGALAEWFGQKLVCETTDRDIQPCGQCQGCRLWAAGSHPDIHVLAPESLNTSEVPALGRYAVRYWPEDKSRETKTGTLIRIDQIRSAITNMAGRPQIAHRRVIVVLPADRMNSNAANALLKLLEEPPPDTQFILVTDRPMRLAPTIRSRCVRLEFFPVNTRQATDWLASQGVPADMATELAAMAAGAPVRALDLHKRGFLGVREELVTELAALLQDKTDPVSVAGRWKERGADPCLGWLQGWLADIAGGGAGLPRNPGLRSRLQVEKKRLNLKQLFEFWDVVARARGQLGGPVDELLMLEETLTQWCNLNRSPAFEK